MVTLLAIAIGLVVLLNMWATYSIVRSPSYTTGQKLAQLIVVWLLPVLGAAACIIFIRADALSTPADPSPQFFDGPDATGSGH